MSLERRINQARARVPSATDPPRVPSPLNIIDFATNPAFLGIDLYPVQATILKIATGSLELLTDFDRDLIATWERGWDLTEDHGRVRYEGSAGTPPGLVERIERCRELGRQGPREIALVLGRRASKGVMSAVLICDLLYRLLELDGVTVDPPPLGNKTLAVYVMGAKYEQAKRNAFADMRDLIETTPAFAPFRGRSTVDSVSLLTPSQIAAGAVVGRSAGKLEVRAVETTAQAGRGPTMIGLVLDEFAHVGTHAKSRSDTSSIGIYQAITPALAQFPRTGLILQTSSPWEKDGQLYASYQLAAEVDPDSGEAKEPTLITVQLESWRPYEAWDQAAEIEMWPNGPTFVSKTGPIIDRTGLVALHEQEDPDSFATEYGAQFAASVNAYLNPRTLARLTAPYDGWDMEPHHRGADNLRYVAHGDPSRVAANFGFAIGHLERDTKGLPHVFIDDAFAWQPGDYPSGEIDYMDIERQISEILSTYPITQLTFDHYNSAGTIDRLNAYSRAGKAKLRTHAYERTATAPLNWRMAELFKSAAMAGLIHIPPALTNALEELEHLQVTGQALRPPTTGPVTTKDIADAIMNVVYTLIGEDADAIFNQLASLPLTGRPSLTSPRTMTAPVAPRRNGPTELTTDELLDRLGGSDDPSVHGVGARRGIGYNSARGDRQHRGRHW